MAKKKKSKLYQVTVRETVYRVTVVTIELTPEELEDDLFEEKARQAAHKSEWEDVNSDGYEYDKPKELV